MLILVGIGLSEKDLSLKAIETCKAADEVCIDRYTSYITEARIESMSKLFGKPIRDLKRSDMEENAGQIISSARKHDVVILVGGDPLVATTHKILYIAAGKAGVRVEAVHSASILTAAFGISGLDFYRFGQICTIPRWSEHYKPVSFYETIYKNLEANGHSLLLLDYDYTNETSLSVRDAVATMEAAEKHYGKGIIKAETPIVVLHNVSLPSESRHVTTVGKASKLKLGPGPAVIILPARLTEIEREAMGTMCEMG